MLSALRLVARSKHTPRAFDSATWQAGASSDRGIHKTIDVETTIPGQGGRGAGSSTSRCKTSNAGSSRSTFNRQSIKIINKHSVQCSLFIYHD